MPYQRTTKQVKKGENATLKVGEHVKTLYAIELFDAIAIKYIAPKSKEGGLALNLSQDLLQPILQNYLSKGDTLDIKVNGGNDSDKSCKYVTSLKSFLDKLGEAYPGKLNVVWEVNDVVHDNGAGVMESDIIGKTPDIDT